LIGLPAWGAPAGEEGAAAEDSMYGGSAALYFWGQDVPSADTNLNQWVTRMYISPVMQRLVEADFVQYGPRGSGEFTNFTSDNISPAYSRGALAESWEVTADRMVFTIRDGIMWAADGKEHVMQSRPYTAEDCAYALNRVADRGNAGWRTENGGFIDSIHAEGNDCIVETSSFNPGGFANIAQHSGSVHYPRELVEADPGSWDNLVGTGPFMVSEAVVGSHISFARNPQYWRTTTIDGTKYQLPFIDEMIMPNLPDETTQIASLRTGKLDIMGTVSVKYRETLADTSPDLQSNGWVEIWPVVVALNHDSEHLSNKQVRRALMMAVDQEAIIDAVWGYGALYNYPVDWRDGSSILGDFNALPDHITELYAYNPDKARQMIVDAGYPDGFELEITVPTVELEMIDLAEMLAGLWEQDLGVKLNINIVDHNAYGAMREQRTYGNIIMWEGYPLLSSSVIDYYKTGAYSNYSMYSNPRIDELAAEVSVLSEVSDLEPLLQEMFTIALDEVPIIPLAMASQYTYWWPWVKNYYGERNATIIQPPVETLWIDQALKQEMGY
jgi:peptide/nickel transport system substrate-binding protein